MTTYFPYFQPPYAPFTFQPTLDGNVYNCTVVWNLYGQRNYLQCQDSSGNLIFLVAIVETPATISLSALSWSETTLVATGITSLPHGFKIGTIVALTISGAAPSGYNGAYLCSITGPNTFTYQLGANPGQNSAVGIADYPISLCKGYFNSTIVYRNTQFEVSP